MANCPKCGVKLKITDIDQFCPSCGVNMRLCGFEETFYKEAKTAELSQAGWSCRIRRFRTAMIGSKLASARLIFMLLPAAALFIPSGYAALSLPFRKTKLAVSAFGLYSAFSGGELDLISSFASGGAEQAVFRLLLIMMYLIAAAAVFAVLTFLLSFLCFLSIKNMQKIICAVSGLGVVFTAAAIVFMYIVSARSADSVILSAGHGFGLYAAALMFAAEFAVNFLLEKKGITPEYDEGMVERSEIWQRVKAGELNIDDLPYPVVETAETRKIKEEIAAEKEAFRRTQEQKKKEETADE